MLRAPSTCLVLILRRLCTACSVEELDRPAQPSVNRAEASIRSMPNVNSELGGAPEKRTQRSGGEAWLPRATPLAERWVRTSPSGVRGLDAYSWPTAPRASLRTYTSHLDRGTPHSGGAVSRAPIS